MKISYNWLKDYVDFDLSPEELAKKLTNAGLVVDDVQTVEDDYCLDIEVTSNRPDCLGMIGVAREIAALVGSNMQLPHIQFPEAVTPQISECIKVSVEEPIYCPQYTARVIKNITITSSPKWLQKRLACVGLRPVNNIVDVTNYVMMETGQPLHAFDLDKIAGEKIIVRKAQNAEEFVAINEAKRALFHDMLVIADETRPIAIAGVIGGKDSEVSESTTNILLECALFEPGQVRRTAKATAIATDSSYRFERGTDPEGVHYASQRATQLISELAGGEITCGAIDIDSRKQVPRKITLRMERLYKILGTVIKRETASSILRRLQFTILTEIDDFIDIEVPSFRGDVYREIDLIEEVGRVYGYENIPTKTSISIRGSCRSKQEMVEETVRQFLTGIGFYETKTFSIVDLSPMHSVNLWSTRKGINIENPLRQEESRMRTSLLPSLIKIKRHNANYGNEHIKIFEIANVYLPEGKLPQEKLCLSLLDDSDFFTVKGILESLLIHLGIHAKCEWKVFKEPRLFHDEKSTKIQMAGTTIGYLGEAAQGLELKSMCCFLELDLDFLVERSCFKKHYHTLLQFPTVTRDLAIIVEEKVTWSSIEKCIFQTNPSFLKRVNFFDIYRGKQIQKGKKSVAFNMCFQANDRTLKSEEVDASVQNILEALSKNLGAELRKK